MKESTDEDQKTIGEEQELDVSGKPEDKDMILLLQSQLSEANLAREQQVHET